MVRRGHHVHVVLHDDDRGPGVDQAVQLGEQQPDVRRVQARGRLVEQVQGVSAGHSLQLGGQLDALALPAGELGGGLTQSQVPQAHLLQGVERAGRGRQPGEVRDGSVDGEPEHLADVESVPRHLEGLRVEPGAVTHRARPVAAGQEQQLHGDEALARARFAPPAGDVEGEAARTPAPGAGSVGGRERLAHRVEQPRVGGQRGARGAPDRLLVHAHQAVHGLGAQHLAHVGGCLLLVLTGGEPATAGHHLGQHLADQGGLARAGHPGDGGEHAEGQVHIQVVEVVPVHPAQPQPPRWRPRRAGHAVGGVGVQELPGQ